MNIDGFLWLPDILDKLIIKHHVMQDEAEEIFFNRPRYRFVEKGIKPEKMFMRRADKPTAADI